MSSTPDISRSIVLVSGWSDNGWLSGGHAVRMAVELCKQFRRIQNSVIYVLSRSAAMHQAWPKLMKRIESGKASDSADDRRLITASRVWFCLYLFEHQ